VPIYNNPALGQAFSNLAQAFAPPSGSDLLGYAGAAAKKEEAARLSQLFQMAQSPEFNQSVFDRSNIAVGNYNPTQSFYAQDQNNSTAMRGQDVVASTSMSNNAADNVRALEDRRLQEIAAMQRLGVTDATDRYGIDTVAQTALTTNAADNTRALTTNGADNERQLLEAILGAATAPVAQGAMRPGFNPADYGAENVPAVPQFDGRTAPLSETEQKARERQQLADSGQLTDQMLIDGIMGAQTPVEAVGPNGPTFMTPGAAVRTGAQPFVKPSGATETQNYRAPDGKTGTAFFDTTANTWRDTATQQPVPEGAITFNSSLQGGAAETGLGPTTANQTEGNKLEAVLNATEADTNALLQLLEKNPGVAGIPGDVRGMAQNAVSVLGEMKSAFGDLAPDALVTAEQAQAALSRLAPARDPAIQQYRTGIANLAYRVAQMNNPSGEVSRQAYERALESLQGGVLANNQSAKEALGALREQIGRTRETQLQTLRAPGQNAPAAPAPPRAPIAPGTVEEGFRYIGGDPALSTSWEPVQ
jgi:hypothetical protein